MLPDRPIPEPLSGQRIRAAWGQKLTSNVNELTAIYRNEKVNADGSSPFPGSNKPQRIKFAVAVSEYSCVALKTATTASEEGGEIIPVAGSEIVQAQLIYVATGSVPIDTEGYAYGVRSMLPFQVQFEDVSLLSPGDECGMKDGATVFNGSGTGFSFLNESYAATNIGWAVLLPAAITCNAFNDLFTELPETITAGDIWLPTFQSTGCIAELLEDCERASAITMVANQTEEDAATTPLVLRTDLNETRAWSTATDTYVALPGGDMGDGTFLFDDGTSTATGVFTLNDGDST